MPQKFLSIKNFEKYQHYKHRNPPWIRVYKSLFQDREFIKLSISARYLYLGLLTLCSEHANRVPMDCTWIAHRLCMDEVAVDLKPLYRSGFLIASRNHIARMSSTKNASYSDSSDSDSSEVQSTEAAASAALPPPPAALAVPTKPKRPMPLPADFTFTPEMREWALAKGCKEPFAEFERFCSKAKSKGWTYTDWKHAYQNWILNELKWAREKSHA